MIGIALVCYIPALFNGFVNYDDPTLLFENALIQTFSFENTGRIFAEILSGHYSRFNPLVFIAYALIYRFAGFDAFWFHAASILFHTGGTVMVYLLAREMTRNARLSLICALLFAVHPIHVEPVAWASALTHVMYAFFYLCSAYVFHGALHKEKRRAAWVALSFLLFVLAGASFSGGAMTLPLILALLMPLQPGTSHKKLAIWLSPFFALSGYFAYLTIHTAKSADVITNPYFNIGQYPFFERVNQSVVSLLYYIKQTLFPYSYSIVYPEGYFIPFGNGVVTASFMLFTILAAVSRKRFFRLQYFTAGFLFFIIAIAPFLKIYSTSDSIINDRYVYLASFGLFLILAEIIDRTLTSKRKTFQPVALVLSASLGYLVINTWTMSLNWRNGEMLWSQAIKMYPRAYPSYVGRAKYFYAQKEFAKTLADCDRALAYNPNYVDALSLKGLVSMTMGMYEEAIGMYSRVLEQERENISALNNRGAAFLLLGQTEKAVMDFNRSLGLKSGQVDVLYNRGVAYFQSKLFAEAMRDLKSVLAENPDFQPAQEKIDEIKVILREQ